MEFAIKTLCRVLRVNRSTYYKHFFDKDSHKSKENIKLRTHILNTYFKHKQAVGYIAMTHYLKDDYCIKVSSGRVYRLMNKMNLPKMSTVKTHNYIINKEETDDDNLENLLKQQFNVEKPNLVWCSDFTYIKIGYKKYVYLCIIIDLFARKIVGWTVSKKHNSQMVIDTFNKAYISRGCPAGLMFHYDQGSEYRAKAFRRLLDEKKVTQSFSKKGYPFDNAVAECFFKYAKQEQFDRHVYESIEEVNLASFEYIDGEFNCKRLHHHNNLKTPNSVENNYFKTLKSPAQLE